MKSLLLGVFLLALVVMTAYNIQRTRDLADQLQRPVESTKPIGENGPSEPGRGGFFILEDTQICFGTVDATSVVDRAWERAFAFEFARPFASRPCITITSLCKTECYTFNVYDDDGGPTEFGQRGHLVEASRTYAQGTGAENARTREDLTKHLTGAAVRVSYIAIGKPGKPRN